MTEIPTEHKCLVAIRIRGVISASLEIRETLEQLRLKKNNYAVLIDNRQSFLGMLNLIHDYVAYGEPSKKIVTELIRQRGRLEGDKKLTDEYSGSPPPADELKRAYDAFKQSLGRALDAVGPLTAAAVAPEAPPVAAAGALPPALAEEAATRLREAAELGDMAGLAAICSELAAKSEAFAPYAAKVVRLADDFDFDAVLKLTGA